MPHQTTAQLMNVISLPGITLRDNRDNMHCMVDEWRAEMGGQTTCTQDVVERRLQSSRH